MKSENLILVGTVALAGYFAYKAFTLAGKTREALASVGSAVGSGLFDLFNSEKDYLGDMYFYTVEFPNGARHAIGASKVSKAGQFDYIQPPLAAKRWQLVKRKDNKGWYAAAVQ